MIIGIIQNILGIFIVKMILQNLKIDGKKFDAKYFVGRINQMLKVYDGEVFIVELENFNVRLTLENIMSNPDCGKMVFILKKKKNILGAVNLRNLVSNNIVAKTFSDFPGGGERDFLKLELFVKQIM